MAVPERATLRLKLVVSELTAIWGSSSRPSTLEHYARVYATLLGEATRLETTALKALTKKHSRKGVLSKDGFESNRMARAREVARIEEEARLVDEALVADLHAVWKRFQAQRAARLAEVVSDSQAHDALMGKAWTGTSEERRFSVAELKELGPALQDRIFRVLYSWNRPMYVPNPAASRPRDPFAPTQLSEIPLPMKDWPAVPLMALEDGEIERLHQRFLLLAQLSYYHEANAGLEAHFALHDEYPSAAALLGREPLKNMAAVAQRIAREIPGSLEAGSEARKRALTEGPARYRIAGDDLLSTDVSAFRDKLAKALHDLGRRQGRRSPSGANPPE